MAPIRSVGIAALDAEHAACVDALRQLASTRSLAALEKVLSAYKAHFSHEELLLDTYMWKEAAVSAAAAVAGGGGATGGVAGGFDRSASMRKSHFADHARMLRELATAHVEQEREIAGDDVSREAAAAADEEDDEEEAEGEGTVPRAVVERVMHDFEAHANRYDAYGDELGAALRRAGASPTAALAAAMGDTAGDT